MIARPIFQAFAQVVTPDYAYTNPVDGTYATTPEESLSLAYDKANAMWPENVVRRRWYIGRLTASPIPEHRRAIAIGQIEARERQPFMAEAGQ